MNAWTQGHTNPATLPPAVIAVTPPEMLGYAAAAYLAGVAVMQARLDAAHNALTRISPADDDAFTTLESTVTYVLAHCRALTTAEEQAADEIERLRAHLQARRAADTTHPEASCGRCGGPNITWCAPSPLWNAVMRGGSIDGEEEYDGIVCPGCFAQLAEERGIAHRWRLTAEHITAELETVTPSGRIWDERAWLWVDPPPAQTPQPGSRSSRSEARRPPGGR